MAVIQCESFAWSATNTTPFGTRYNAGAGSFSISAAGGPFGEANYNSTNSGQNSPQNNLKQTFTPTIHCGFYWKTDNGGSSGGNQPLMAFMDAATIQCALCLDPATRKLKATRGNSTQLGLGSIVIQNSSWYHIEIVATIDPAAGVFKVYVNGILDINLTAQNTRVSAANQVTAWQVTTFSAAGGAGCAWADLYFADDTTQRGETRVLLLTPTANGATNMWTPSAGSNFQCVDEIPPNGDTDYVSSAASGDQDLYTYTSLSYTPASVYGVQVSLYARKDDGAARQVATLVRSGGTTFTGTPQTITASYTDFYTQFYATDPATAAAWTPAGVNGAQYGVQQI